jgi:fatty-acyl-CoA synthase
MKGLMQDSQLTLQTVLSRAAELYPDKVVATKTAEDIHRQTFGALVERVNRLASALSDLGVRPGDRVATFAYNSNRHLELYLAVPCMGAVLHTLNPRLPADQASYIVNHAEDKVAFVDASLAGAWARLEGLDTIEQAVSMPDGGEGVAEAPNYEELLGAAGDSYPWPQLDEDDAAAMCYTSGTTGNPKGVVYSHRSSTLHAMASLFADSMALSESDVMMPIVPQFHANAWGTPYAAVMTGASVAMAGRFMDPQSVSTLVAEQGVTISAAVPTVWFGVLEAIKAGQIERESLASLERIVIGGSAVPEALMRGFDELGIRMIHAWGMTETSPLGTLASVKSTVPESEVLQARLTQGLPAPTLRVRIIDGEGNVAPWDGETMGELQITGPWIADAYYEPTEPDSRGGLDSFTDDADGTRWLRTGDVASIDEHGYVKLVDRTKDLVKSGGEWISTVDLENTIMAHTKVSEAAVIAVPHPKWDERPLACVVAGDDSVTTDELLGHVAEQFPRWQLPDDVVYVDEIPKTAVGKMDKKVLRGRFDDYQLPAV